MIALILFTAATICCIYFVYTDYNQLEDHLPPLKRTALYSLLLSFYLYLTGIDYLTTIQ